MPDPSAPTLSLDDVYKVASLARLSLDEAEAERMTHQLNDLLAQFSRLQELNTDDVPPTSHAVPVEALLREDVVKPSLPQKDVLALTKDTDEYLGGFIVPQVIGE